MEVSPALLATAPIRDLEALHLRIAKAARELEITTNNLTTMQRMLRSQMRRLKRAMWKENKVFIHSIQLKVDILTRVSAMYGEYSRKKGIEVRELVETLVQPQQQDQEERGGEIAEWGTHEAVGWYRTGEGALNEALKSKSQTLV